MKKKERFFHSVVEDIRRDLVTLHTLEGRERAEFIWDYYRWRILAVVLAVFVLISGIRILWEGQRPYRLRVCAVLNDQQVSCSSWFGQFERKLRSDGSVGALDLNEDQPFDYDNRYYQVMEMEVMTTISSRRMDVAICGEDMFSYLLALNACMPLDDVLPELSGLFEQGRAGVTQRADGSLDLESGTDGNYALNLSGTQFYREYNEGSEEPLYAVVLSNTDHLQDSLFLLRELAK